MKKIINWLLSVPAKHLWLFALGMFLCALCGILLPKFAEWPLFPLVLLGAIVFGLSHIKQAKPPIAPLIWWSVGALLIQILLWLTHA